MSINGYLIIALEESDTKPILQRAALNAIRLMSHFYDKYCVMLPYFPERKFIGDKRYLCTSFQKKKNQYSALTAIPKKNKRKTIYNKDKFQCELPSTSIKETRRSRQMPSPRRGFTGSVTATGGHSLGGPAASAIQMLWVALPSAPHLQQQGITLGRVLYSNIFSLGAATVENTMVFPQKIKNRIAF